MSDELLDLHLKHLSDGDTSNRTIQCRRSVLRLLNKWLPFGLAFAATEQIEAWFGDLRERRRSQWTLSIYDYHVKAFYLWATKSGFLDGDPATTITAPRHPRGVPKPVTEDQLSKALGLPEPFRTAVILAAFEGMRASEIAACWREHITAEAVTIPVGKGGHYGVVPTHAYVWQELSGRPPGPLIVNRDGNPVTGHWLTMRIRSRFDAIGLGRDETGQRVHLHRLRHRYGTLIQAEFKDLRVTQECLRHQRVSSTEIYTLVTSAQRTAAVASLPVPGGPSRSVAGSDRATEAA